VDGGRWIVKKIATKFAVLFGVFALAFSAFAVYRTWSVSEAHVRELTARQAALALEFDLAIRRYVADHIRPAMQEALGPDEFHPETMSTSFVARSIFQEVRKKFPEYVIKFSSPNPRNPANQAGPEELDIIEYFKRNPDAKRWVGEVRMGGKAYYAHFKPRRMTESCLRCHGDPKDAPKSLLSRYGAAAGFNLPVGDVIATDMVAIPMDKVNAALASEALEQSVGMIAALGVMFVGILWMFRRLISRRLAAITGHLRKAVGDRNIPDLKPIARGGSDEISVMADGYNALVERLRDLYGSLELRVRQRTEELIKTNERLTGEIAERRRTAEQLSGKMSELEQFNRLAVGREQRMIELKREVNEFARKAGAAPPYDRDFVEDSEPAPSARMDGQ